MVRKVAVQHTKGGVPVDVMLTMRDTRSIYLTHTKHRAHESSQRDRTPTVLVVLPKKVVAVIARHLVAHLEVAQHLHGRGHAARCELARRVAVYTQGSAGGDASAAVKGVPPMQRSSQGTTHKVCKGVELRGRGLKRQVERKT